MIAHNKKYSYILCMIYKSRFIYSLFYLFLVYFNVFTSFYLPFNMLVLSKFHFLDFFELKLLEELDLSENEFEGPLPPSFANMSSLRMLNLSSNHFRGNFGSNLASLTSLEYLDFGGNQFEVPISFTLFANYSNLKFTSI